MQINASSPTLIFLSFSTHFISTLLWSLSFPSWSVSLFLSSLATSLYSVHYFTVSFYTWFPSPIPPPPVSSSLNSTPIFYPWLAFLSQPAWFGLMGLIATYFLCRIYMFVRFTWCKGLLIVTVPLSTPFISNFSDFMKHSVFPSYHKPSLYTFLHTTYFPSMFPPLYFF